LLLNPCSFTRRVIVDVENCPHLLPLDGPVKACQVDGTTARAVVEVPALGFAWIPRKGDPSLRPSPKRMKLADKKAVRNETFEAEIDQDTGGLRGLRDHRTRSNRLGQQLVFQPGSTMRATAINVTSTGPAYGEVVAEGVLVDAHDNELARFRQRYQAWVGRPMLELRIEIFPNDLPQGSAWHAYYGARFAWRDEYAALLRGVGGVGYLTSHSRPVTPDYLELRVGQQNTVIFPGGLPFHQRHGGRMLDVLLLTPGESARCFDLGIGLDRQIPLQTAQGVVSPVVAVPVEKGPPHVGATGWLCHVDAANLLLTCMRPVPDADAVTARFLETTGYDGMGEVRFVRNPVRARYENSLGEPSMELTVQQDAVHVEFTRHDLLQTRVTFSEET
jgi:hypothetical protein